MQVKFFFLLLATGFFFTTSASAQTSANSHQVVFPNHHSDDKYTLNGDDWAFFLDNENKVYYIDFEAISVNLSDLKVVNKDGDVVKSDSKLWDLPVNTIYELNISDLKPGNYQIELRSYTGVIKKEIVLSE